MMDQWMDGWMDDGGPQTGSTVTKVILQICNKVLYLAQWKDGTHLNSAVPGVCGSNLKYNF